MAPINRNLRLLWFALAATSVSACALADEFTTEIQPLLKTYCTRCHSGDEPKGELDFTKITTGDQVTASFEVWQSAFERLNDGTMPPEDERQPSATDKATFNAWYQERFVKSVKAHPGFFRPRRLSAVEYGNTLESLVGFELKVAISKAEQTVAEESLVLKLLPTDPPGPSGFTNDTSGSPLTTVLWDQYSILADHALDNLFSSRYRPELEHYTGKVNGKHLTPQQAERMLRSFVRRAYRGRIEEASLAKSLAAIEGRQGKDLEKALILELKTALMSPGFLYRGLLMKLPPEEQQPVDDLELAERLSYFLWADMPDEELLELALTNKLSDEETYRAQIIRMLRSPKARSLAEDFGEQWFSLNEIDHTSKNPPVAQAMKSQPMDFLDYLFTEGALLTELVDSKTTFVNPITAGHYGSDRGQMKPYRRQRGIEIEHVKNQRITLNKTPERGGLLTMPGVLAMNKGPVQRGTWILERVLNEHLPDPPADVGQVAGNKRGENLTFRQRFEQHRSNKSCASCHDKIDPLGFALQAYNAAGGFTASSPKNKIDSSGRLPSGETFADFRELKQILVTSQRERVVKTIVERTMSYALCRKLELHDQPAIEKIVKTLHERNGTFDDLFVEVANSLPFRETVMKGQREEAN